MSRLHRCQGDLMKFSRPQVTTSRVRTAITQLRKQSGGSSRAVLSWHRTINPAQSASSEHPEKGTLFAIDYNYKQRKFFHRISGTVAIPQADFQLIAIDQKSTTGPETLPRTYQFPSKIPEYVRGFEDICLERFGRKKMVTSLRLSLRELKGLKLPISDMNKIQEIIRKEPYHRPDSRTFLKACKDCSEQLVRNFLSQDRYLVYAIDNSGMSGLHWACLRGYLPIARTLLANKPNVNLQDSVLLTQSRRTPLFIAAKNDDLELVELLLLHSADPTTRCTKNLLPVDVTSLNVIEFLLKKAMRVSST